MGINEKRRLSGFLAVLFIMGVCLSLLTMKTYAAEKQVFYWNFNGHARDASSKYLDVEGADQYTYAEGTLGKALDLTNGDEEVRTDYTDCDFTNFTMAAWVYLDADVPDAANFQIVMAKDIKQAGHFEIFFQRVGEQYQLEVYAFDLGGALQYTTSPVDLGKWLHIAATYDGQILRLYLNGKEVIQQTYTQSVASGTESIVSFGSLVESGLNLYGKIDEAILANYAFEPAQITKLHDHPAEAANDLMTQISAAYPSGKTPRPDAMEAESPTPQVSGTPAQAATATADKTPTPKASASPKSTETTSRDPSLEKWLLPAIIILLTLAATAVILFVIIKPGKKK